MSHLIGLRSCCVDVHAPARPVLLDSPQDRLGTYTTKGSVIIRNKKKKKKKVTFPSFSFPSKLEGRATRRAAPLLRRLMNDTAARRPLSPPLLPLTTRDTAQIITSDAFERTKFLFLRFFSLSLSESSFSSFFVRCRL